MARKNDKDDLLEDIPSYQLIRQPKPFIVYEEIHTARDFHIYLTEAIGRPSDYTDLFHLLRTAYESDTIYIHLNTPGGALATGVQLINAIRQSDARVVTVIDGLVMSLGTLIFLSGDEFVVQPDSLIMLHNFSSVIDGPGHTMALELKANTEWFNHIARSIYIPFISEEEFERLIQGVDIWLMSDEITNRLQKVCASNETTEEE